MKLWILASSFRAVVLMGVLLPLVSLTGLIAWGFEFLFVPPMFRSITPGMGALFISGFVLGVVCLVAATYAEYTSWGRIALLADSVIERENLFHLRSSSERDPLVQDAAQSLYNQAKKAWCDGEYKKCERILALLAKI